ncbi:pentapeptide repeat-containing protein [Mastigocladopsis repens]|uniref:pentapeptide repeat-containing protein n=1 Tax=Mastigocladopsis repens TaxID=221287 RepID=UPI0003827B30
MNTQELGTPGDMAESGAEVSKAALEFMIALGLLASVPAAPVVAAGLSFVGITRKGLNLLRGTQEPNLEQWVAIAFPLAYIQSFDTLVQTNDWLRQKLQLLQQKNDDELSSQEVRQQLDQLGEFQLDKDLAEEALTYFPESKLGQALNQQLSIYLQQEFRINDEDKAAYLQQKVRINDEDKAAPIVDNYTASIVTGWVAWGTHECVKSLLKYEPENFVKPLSLTIAAAQETRVTKKYSGIESYLKEQISPNPSNPVLLERWKVIGEEFKIPDIYVPLKTQLVNSNGTPVDLENWAKNHLRNPDKNGQVMFIQGGPGRGKSVFCRMFADWVRQHLHPIWTPVLIRLRDIHAFYPDIKKTLRAAVNADFAESDDGWLTDSNTRFLFLLDGFDELRMEGRTTKGIEEFLQQVGNFQKSCQQNPQLGHRFLVTGRESALQGIERFIPPNLERVEISLMDDQLQQQWFSKWKQLFDKNLLDKKKDNAKAFQKFLQAQSCPERVQQLAKEPLLLYLLAAMHRDGQITDQMFEGVSSAKAKILIYQKTLDWVLTKQRPKDLNRELTTLETEGLRRILAEAGLCVTQTGGEFTLIKHIEERLKFDDDAKELLEEAQKRIGENPLRNALAAFYLRPTSATSEKEGAVEFVHKSFGEFLCAQRLRDSLVNWVSGEQRFGRWKYSTRKDQLEKEIYDLLGYGGLTQEIVDYLMALLVPDSEEKFQPTQFECLFERLKDFYHDWCEGRFINVHPKNPLDEEHQDNLPQNKMMQLQKYGSKLGLREVDIYTGLNVMILLLELHRYAQSSDELEDKIAFHPCGQQNTKDFDNQRLSCIISYSNSIAIGTFLRIAGVFLSGANLSDADLSNADLSGADLSGAILSGANLSGANLSGADLSGANLSGANLSGAILSGAILSGAILNDANLRSANLSGANLSGADLRSADLRSANLSRANLSGADLSRAIVSGANLSRANLSGAIVSGAILSGAILSGAILSRAILSRADLSGANLSRANLSDANLSDANLRSANLSGANLTNIIWNQDTKREDVRGLETAVNKPEAF